MDDISSENQTEWKKSYGKNLEKVLQKKEKWIKVDDFDVEAGCPSGENFAAEVERIVVYGRKLCLGQWTEIRKNFIVKKVPEPTSPCHRYCDCLRMFQNEVFAYDSVLPMLQKYLEHKSKSDAHELSFPRFYGQGQRFLVLQDLQTEGYQVVNRTRGFGARECSLILRELSKFHALSFAMKEEEKLNFHENSGKLKEVIFYENAMKNFNTDFWEDSVKFAIKSLKESKDVRFRKSLESLKLCSGRIFYTMISIIKIEYSKFEVICHGDLWNNNIMLRYCESGYPVGVRFIDLQAMRYSSCVLDVMHVLFTSSRPAILKNCFDLLIKEYYDSLMYNLEDLGATPNFTFDEFMSEFRRKIHFGVFIACVMFTCITKTQTSDRKANIDDFERMYGSLGPGYHERLHALFSALTETDLF